MTERQLAAFIRAVVARSTVLYVMVFTSRATSEGSRDNAPARMAASTLLAVAAAFAVEGWFVAAKRTRLRTVVGGDDGVVRVSRASAEGAGGGC